MSGITLQSFGAAAGVIILSVAFFQYFPNWIKAIKGEKPAYSGGEGNDTKDDFKSVLENNTKALVELTQFLQTQSAVDKEREKHSAQQLIDISVKLDKLTEMIQTHAVKCDSSCRQ